MTFIVIWQFIRKHWVKFVIAGGVILLLFVGSIIYKRLTTPSLNIKETQEVIESIRQGNDEKLVETLAKHDVRIAEGKEEITQADAKAEEIQKKIQDAKKDYEGWSSEDLAAEAERRMALEK